MMGKKLISIGLSMVMLASTAVCGYAAEEDAAAAEETTAAEESTAAEETAEEEISAEDVSVTWEDSHVYDELTLGRYKTITTYGVAGYEDVPFISAADYLDILCDEKEKITLEDGVMTVSLNGTEAVIDAAADTIRFENASLFRSTGNGIAGAIVDKIEFNVITVSEKHESAQEDAKPLTISLSEYHMPVIAYEDTILMPFLALQNTFGSVRMSNVLAYNGKDYYNVYEAMNDVANEEASMDSPYLQAIYSGPFSEKTEASQAYAEYSYYSTCLLLDLTYGHKEEKNITTFDEYFTRINAKAALSSAVPSNSFLAEITLFMYLFDSGHDGVFGKDSVFDESEGTGVTDIANLAEDMMQTEEGASIFDENPLLLGGKDGQDPTLDAFLGALAEKGYAIPDIVGLLAWTYYFDGNKPDGYGDERLDFAGDTAVIYFNAFKDNTPDRNPSYYVDPINEEDVFDSTFAFFYTSFEEIQKHKDVKNVVINLSDNGGGAAAALVSVLGFLSEDGEVKITDQDLMAGSYREEWYHVDTNLDGIADDQDGFGGQYDFYIMCSGSSYSCGNALPYFAQKEGLATIIGTKPGGGDCVVASFVDAYGRCASNSGMLKLGRYEDDGEFVSDETVTEPDLNMMTSILDIKYVPWYDPEGIADVVHQYQEGATEITYNDMTDNEKVTELLGGFLERFTENLGSELGVDTDEAEETDEAA